MSNRTLQGDIATDLQKLAREMKRVAKCIALINTMTARLRADEMRGAAKMAQQWAKSLRQEHREILERQP